MPSVQPSHRDLAAAGVEADRDLARVHRRELVDELRVARSRSVPDDDPRRAGRQQVAARPRRSRTPPPAWTRHGTAAQIASTTARLTRLTGAGGVEVDDVDPLRAGGGEARAPPATGSSS